MLRQHETYTMRGAGATKKLFAALLVALLTALMLTPPAFCVNTIRQSGEGEIDDVQAL